MMISDYKRQYAQMRHMYRNVHLRTTNQMYDQLNGKSVVSERGNQTTHP